eukprot:354987-Chlamydomonas_euryale.AAC.11
MLGDTQPGHLMVVDQVPATTNFPRGRRLECPRRPNIAHQLGHVVSQNSWMLARTRDRSQATTSLVVVPPWSERNPSSGRSDAIGLMRSV